MRGRLRDGAGEGDFGDAGAGAAEEGEERDEAADGGREGGVGDADEDVGGAGGEGRGWVVGGEGEDVVDGAAAVVGPGAHGGWDGWRGGGGGGGHGDRIEFGAGEVGKVLWGIW